MKKMNQTFYCNVCEKFYDVRSNAKYILDGQELCYNCFEERLNEEFLDDDYEW